MCMYMCIVCIYIYIYVYIERERCVYIYIYAYTHTYCNRITFLATPHGALLENLARSCTESPSPDLSPLGRSNSEDQVSNSSSSSFDFVEVKFRIRKQSFERRSSFQLRPQFSIRCFLHFDVQPTWTRGNWLVTLGRSPLLEHGYNHTNIRH